MILINITVGANWKEDWHIDLSRLAQWSARRTGRGLVLEQSGFPPPTLGSPTAG